MKRALVILAILCLARPAAAHVGSPDVFFDGNAGPYALSVTVRTPQVIPGVATIEVRAADADVQGVTVVPMRLTGPGSQLPPTPDRATRSAADPQFFTADLWLMERGSLQVRITATGARGTGVLAVPVPANARATLAMDRGLGTLLLALMLVLALGFVGIAAGAARDAALEPGAEPSPRARRRTRIAAVVTGAAVTGVLALGNLWWNAEAGTYAAMVDQPWHVDVKVDACTLTIPALDASLLPDHGHLVHLFLVRAPALDVLAHLHPERAARGFTQALPSLPAGRYHVFADVVLDSGYPYTGTADLDLPATTCPAPTGDDTVWSAAEPPDVRITWDRPVSLRAGVATPLRFHVAHADGTPAALEPYMGMAGHAEVTNAGGTVFAHLHPNGSVAMPALELAQGGAMPGMSMPGMDMPLPADVSFPYGFPRAGAYRVFVQVKTGGRIVTGAFDANVP